jgi:hypothetical protein
MEKVQRRGKGPKLAVTEHSDRGTPPLQSTGETHLVDEGDDLVLVGENVVVEALYRCSGHFEAHYEAAEVVTTLYEDYLEAFPGQA